MENKIKRTLFLIADFVLPAKCPVCDRIQPPGRSNCPECNQTVKKVRSAYCMRCGKPLSDETKITCTDCKIDTNLIERGRVVFEYGSVAGLLYKLKYSARFDYARYLGEEAAKVIEEEREEWKPDCIVPVPLHPNRKLERGYNQVEEVAKHIKRVTNIPVRTDLVRRVIDTKPLKYQSSDSRRNNLKNAFKLVRNDVKLESIIILDDFYTTGSTIQAVALELKRLGVQKIYFVTLAAGKGM